MLRQKKPTLQATVQETRSATVQLNDAAARAVLYSADFWRLAKFTKRLGPLLDEVADISGLDVDVEQQGVQAFKNVTQALQQLVSFAGQCSGRGPVYALLQHIALAQQLTNCSIDLCSALAAVDVAALQVSTDLQEDLSQHVRQLQHNIGCCYSQQQHSTLLELYVQAEAVRAGKADASTLSAILTQQVLQCSRSQLAADVAYLQQAGNEQQQASNHVGASFYQQLATICKALLPADSTASSSLVPLLQRFSDHQAEDPKLPAVDLLSVLVQPEHGKVSGRLQAALVLALTLTSDAAALPPELAAHVEITALPKAPADDVLQALLDPVILKACVGVLSAQQQATDTQQDVLVKQATAYILERAVAAEPAVSAAVVTCKGCLASLVKLVLAGSTASSTPDCIKVAVIQLLCTLCRTEAATVASCTKATAAPTATSNTLPAAALLASKELVEQHKVIPALVQILGEVKVVKGRAAVSLCQRPASVAAGGMPQGSSSAAAPLQDPSGKAARGVAKGEPAAGAAAKGRVAGRSAEAGSGSAAFAAAPPTAAAAPPSAPSGEVVVMMMALKLLQALSGSYRALMQAAGIMPALSGLLASKDAAVAALHPDVVCLLELLLQQDRAAAMEAMRNNMLPALASVFEKCAASNGHSSLQQAVCSALLLLLHPPARSSAAAACSVVPVDNKQQAVAAHNVSQAAAGKRHSRPALAGDVSNGVPNSVNEQVDINSELGRCCSVASVTAGMQLLSLGPSLGSELTMHLLKMLLVANFSQEARAATFAHQHGMAALITLATSAPTPVWGRMGPYTAADVSAAGFKHAGESTPVVAAAADMLVHIGQEQQIKPKLAQPLAELLLGGSAEQRASVAWLVSRLAACHAAADKIAARSAADFCKEMGCALAPVLELLHSSNADQKAAGAAAVRSLATYGDVSLQGSLLAGGAVPPLVDVLRSSTATGQPLAAVATAALGALAAAAVLSAGAAVCDLLVSCLHPSSAAVAAKVADASLEIARAYPSTVSFLVNAGALPACLKLLHECSTNSNSFEASRGAARLLAWLLRSHSNTSTSSSTSAATQTSSSSNPTAAGKHTASNPAPTAAAISNSCNSRTDLPPSAVSVLLQALHVRDDAVRLPAAAALGQLLRKPAAVVEREAAVAAKAVAEVLDVLRSTVPPVTSTGSESASTAAAPPALVDWAWEDAAAGLAALGALHNTACVDLAQGLRHMALRGGPRDAGTAAIVAANLAASPRGRMALLSEGVVAGLVGVISNAACSAAARAAAADAIGSIAVPSIVMLDSGTDGSGDAAYVNVRQPGSSHSRGQGSPVRQQQQSLPAGARVVDPKLEAVRAGAVAALIGLVKSGAGQHCALEAAETLYILAGCQAGRDAALAAGGRDVLQEVVLAGKRREVGAKVAKAAYEALMRFL